MPAIDKKTIVTHISAALILWVMFALMFATASYFQLIRMNTPGPYLKLLISNAVWMGSTALIAPLIFAVGRRQAQLKQTLLRHLIHILLAFLLAYGIHAVYVAFVIAPYAGKTAAGLFANLRIGAWISDGFTMVAYVASGYAYGFAEKNQRSKIDAAELNIQLAKMEAELASEQSKHLRQRLGSHFVLNALSNIIALVRRENAAKAIEALHLLSDILRSIAHQDDDTLCTLETEITFLQKYLNFQSIRYPSLELTWNIAPETLTARLPSHILQPIAENAFKHGMKADGGLSLKISAERQNKNTIIRIENSIDQPVEANGQGEGQTLTRLRLQKHYGPHGLFSWAVEDGQYVATLSIPDGGNDDD